MNFSNYLYDKAVLNMGDNAILNMGSNRKLFFDYCLEPTLYGKSTTTQIN